MVVNVEQENTIVKLWYLLSRVGDTIMRCQDSVYGKYGLTAEKFGVLTTIKARGPQKPSEISVILERSPNSVSMLVDRMVKAGLVRRTRDRKDRRVVYVSVTEKGRAAIEPAFPVGWEFIQEVLSTLSADEQRNLANLLEKVKCELGAYLDPQLSAEDIAKDSRTNDPDLYKRMVETFFPPAMKRSVRREREPGKAL